MIYQKLKENYFTQGIIRFVWILNLCKCRNRFERHAKNLNKLMSWKY